MIVKPGGVKSSKTGGIIEYLPLPRKQNPLLMLSTRNLVQFRTPMCYSCGHSQCNVRQHKVEYPDSNEFNTPYSLALICELSHFSIWDGLCSYKRRLCITVGYLLHDAHDSPVWGSRNQHYTREAQGAILLASVYEGTSTTISRKKCEVCQKEELPSPSLYPFRIVLSGTSRWIFLDPFWHLIQAGILCAWPWAQHCHSHLQPFTHMKKFHTPTRRASLSITHMHMHPSRICAHTSAAATAAAHPCVHIWVFSSILSVFSSMLGIYLIYHS